MEITPIPAFADNYIWLLQGPDPAQVAVVDPGDAAPVLARLEALGLGLGSILVTHHHGDHVGGIRELLARFPDAVVYGPAGERIPGRRVALADGDAVAPPGLEATFRVLDVPGHTAGHIAYAGAGSLFCGDTLFACGCGRLFEGTPAQMQASLARLAALPGDTRVYCAHEYTLENIGFAKWVEPESAELRAREERDLALQEAGVPTLPTTLDLELRTNPFLRWDAAPVVAAAERYAAAPLRTPVDVFAAVRRWKDLEYD
jgi:hydroxyacylglutathione hydrolase